MSSSDSSKTTNANPAPNADAQDLSVFQSRFAQMSDAIIGRNILLT
ncbi:hypothetical protein CCR75_005796 [Bremia lactucae]|uniref:Uncharacterized protein n=1 Tax=Bremia lactucae TaxID=4779 RepID=A0A976IC51_BRELC|nr:hypothetical protein CCR75_005796 [Bremia lactucae]